MHSAALTLLAIGAPLVAANFNCSIRPIYVDMHNRSVTGTQQFQYGAFIGLGEPAQNQSFLPSLTNNQSAFAAPNYCQGDTDPLCVNNTHGFFQKDFSSTWRDTPDYQSLDVPPPNQTFISRTFGTDDLRLYTHFFEPDPPTVTLLRGYAAEILSNVSSSNFFGPSGRLGVASASPLLQQLYDASLISCRSFGLYFGMGYDRAGGVKNGSITFGGYDSGRFHHPVHNYTLGIDNTASGGAGPVAVHVSSITLSDPADLTKNITLTDDAGFDATITTDQYPLYLPDSVTEAFSNALSAEPANNFDNSLKINQPYAGNLTITLSDGFTVSFPSEWVSNTSGITPVQASAPPSASNSTSQFLLGASYLTHAYLALNYDASPPAFYLAHAIPGPNYVMPQPFCPGMAPMAYEKPLFSDFTKNGMIGAVVGGVLGGTFLTFVAWIVGRWWWRRRADKADSPKMQQHPYGADKYRGMEMEDLVSATGDDEENEIGGGGRRKLLLNGGRQLTFPPPPRATLKSKSPKTKSKLGPGWDRIPEVEKQGSGDDPKKEDHRLLFWKQ